VIKPQEGFAADFKRETGYCMNVSIGIASGLAGAGGVIGGVRNIPRQDD
jgi:hypothetical protein